MKHEWNEEMTWSPEEKRCYELYGSNTASSDKRTLAWLLNDIHTDPEYRNPRIGRWGMERFEFLMEESPSAIVVLGRNGWLQGVLAQCDAIGRIRGVVSQEEKERGETPESKMHSVIHADPSVFSPLTLTTEEEDRLLELESKRYPYILHNIQVKQNFKLSSYESTRLEYLVYHQPELLWNLVQQGQLSEDLFNADITMSAAMAFWTDLDMSQPKAPQKDDPNYRQYLKTTQSQLYKRLKDIYLFPESSEQEGAAECLKEKKE